MTITYAFSLGGYSVRRFVCTHNDPLCSDSAVVIVLEDGRWYGDALCADHAPPGAGAGTPMVAVPMAEWTELVETYDAWGRDRLVGSLEVAEAAEALIDASRGVS